MSRVSFGEQDCPPRGAARHCQVRRARSLLSMQALAAGSRAPQIPDLDFGSGATVLFFYKVTCPVCQLSAPAVQTFETSYPGRILGIGQDPGEKLSAFSRTYGIGFPSRADTPPYELSNAYGVRVVPTTFLINTDAEVLGVVQSWDRAGMNDLSRRLASLVGAEYRPISEDGDGLPAFRPG